MSESLLSQAELDAMLGSSGSGETAQNTQEKEEKQKLLAALKEKRKDFPKTLTQKESSLLNLHRKLKDSWKSLKDESLSDIKEYQISLDVFSELRTQLNLLAHIAEAPAKIIEILKNPLYTTFLNTGYFLSFSEEIRNAVASPETPSGEDLPDSGEKSDSEEPIPGVTKMYLPPKRGSDETTWKEVLFVRSETSEDKGETFVVKFSPNGQEIRLSRQTFHKTPEEGAEVDSRFSDSSYYKGAGDDLETRKNREKKEFKDGDTVYFLAPERADHAGKYREGKIVIVDGRKKVWFGSFDKDGNKKLNALRLSDLLDFEGLSKLQPDLEVIPFEERQPRSRDASSEPRPPFNPDESVDSLVRSGSEPVPAPRREITNPPIEAVGTIVESFGRKFTIGQDVKFVKNGKEILGKIKSFNPVLESLTVVYQEMDAGALVTREKPFVGDEDIESLIVSESVGPGTPEPAAPVEPAPDMPVPPNAPDILSQEEIDALLAQAKEEERIEAERLRGLPRFSFVYDHGRYASPKDVPTSEKERSFETIFGAFSIISDYGGEGSKYKRQNEDSYCLVPTPDGGFAVVVIDGAGGSSNGLDASRSMVVSFEHQLSSGSSIRDSFFAAHQVLSNLNEQQGTDAYGVACALKISSEGQVDLGSVGDSKVLTIRDKKVLKEGTTDFENVANGMVKLGVIKPEQYFQGQKNVIENSIGSGKMKWEASNERHFRGATGDRVIMASDGLWDVVSEYEVLELSESSRTAEELRKKLFDLVYSRYNDGNSFTINFDGTIQVPMDYNYGDNITIGVFDLDLDKISRPAKTSEALPLSQEEIDAFLAQVRGTPEPSPRPAISRFDGAQNPDVFRGNPQAGEVFRIHGNTESGNTVDFTVMVTAIGYDSLTLLEYGEEKPFQQNIDWWNSWAHQSSMEQVSDADIKRQLDSALIAEQANQVRFREVPGVEFRGNPQVGEVFNLTNDLIKIISIKDTSLCFYIPGQGRVFIDLDEWNDYADSGDIRLTVPGQFEREIAAKEIFIGSPQEDRVYHIKDALGAVSEVIHILKISDTEIVYKDLLHQSSSEKRRNPTEWKQKVGSFLALEGETSDNRFITEKGKIFEVGGKMLEVGKKYYYDQLDGTQEEVEIEAFLPNINVLLSEILYITNDFTEASITGDKVGRLSESRRPISRPIDTAPVFSAPLEQFDNRQFDDQQYVDASQYFEAHQKATFAEFVEFIGLDGSVAIQIMNKLIEDHVIVQKKKFGFFGKPVYQFVPEDKRPSQSLVGAEGRDPAFTDNLSSNPDTSPLDTGTPEPLIDLSPASPEVQEQKEVPIDLNFEFISPSTLQKYLREFSIAIMNENQDAVNLVTTEVQNMFAALTEEDFKKFKFADQYTDLAAFQKMWKEQGAPMFCSMLDEMTSHNLQCAINANPDVKKALAIHNELPFKKAVKRGFLWGAGSGFAAATLMRLLSTALPGIVATAAATGTIVLREKERYDFAKNQKQVDTKKESTKKSVNDSFLEFQTAETMQGRLDNIAKRIAFRKGNPKARQEVYQESLDDMISSLEKQIREKELALAQLSITDTGARTPLETEILGLKREKIMLKADKALNIHKNNRGGVSDLTYNEEALEKIENSAFFSNAWDEATHGDKRLSKQFTSKWGDRLWGHFVAGAVNAAAAVTVSEALPHFTGADSFFGRFGIRGLAASIVKGGEAGLLSRRNVEASQLRKIREAQQMLGSKNKDQLDAADKKMQAAQKVATWKDTTKAVAKRGIVAGVTAGTIGAGIDYGRELLFSPEQAPAQDPTLTESTEAQQPKYEGTPSPESTPQEKLAAAYGEPTRANGDVLLANEYHHTPQYTKFLNEFNTFIEQKDMENARIRVVWMLQEGGSPEDNARNIHHLIDMLPKQEAVAYKSIFFLKDDNYPGKLFIKIDPTRQGLYSTVDHPNGSHIVEVTPSNLHEVFVARNTTAASLDNVLKTFEHADAPAPSSAPHVEAPASAPIPELSADGTALSEKVLADIKYVHSYKSEYLDKLVNSIGEKSQDIVTSAHSKLKIIEDLIRSRAEAGNPMSSDEIVKELQTRSTSDEWLLLNSDNTCNSDHPIVVDKNSFAFFDKITEQRFFHNDPGKIYTLQDREHLRIHDISTNTDKVVSLRDNGGGKLDILEELR